MPRNYVISNKRRRWCSLRYRTWKEVASIYHKCLSAGSALQVVGVIKMILIEFHISRVLTFEFWQCGHWWLMPGATNDVTLRRFRTIGGLSVPPRIYCVSRWECRRKVTTSFPGALSWQFSSFWKVLTPLGFFPSSDVTSKIFSLSPSLWLICSQRTRVFESPLCQRIRAIKGALAKREIKVTVTSQTRTIESV